MENWNVGTKSESSETAGEISVNIQLRECYLTWHTVLKPVLHLIICSDTFLYVQVFEEFVIHTSENNMLSNLI